MCLLDCFAKSDTTELGCKWNFQSYATRTGWQSNTTRKCVTRRSELQHSIILSTHTRYIYMSLNTGCRWDEQEPLRRRFRVYIYIYIYDIRRVKNPCLAHASRKQCNTRAQRVSNTRQAVKEGVYIYVRMTSVSYAKTPWCTWYTVKPACKRDKYCMQSMTDSTRATVLHEQLTRWSTAWEPMLRMKPHKYVRVRMTKSKTMLCYYIYV
jgi:hypothetical protein